MVRVQGKIKSPLDFERIIVARRGTGAATIAVTLGQLADVRDTQREETSLATMNGKRGVSIEIRKTRGSNTLEMAQAIRKQIVELKKTLPADISLEVTNDQSEFIKDSVDNVKHTIIEGALLTVMIVFLFLHSWRSTVITGLTLPISVFATFIAMYAFGFTLNFITLLALSLSIGVLIDDAIVVRENIVRHLRMGEDAPPGGAGGDRGDRPRRDGDHLHDRRGVRAGGVHGRHHRQVLLPVRHHRRRWRCWCRSSCPSRSTRCSRRYGAIRRRVDQADRILGASSPSWTGCTSTTTGAALAPHPPDHHARARRDDLRRLPSCPSSARVASRRVDKAGAAGIQTPSARRSRTPRKAERQVEATLKVPIRRVNRVARTRRGSASTSWTARRSRSQKEIDDAIRERLKGIAGLEVNIGWNRPIRIFVQGPDIRELDRISKEVIAKIKAIPGTVDVESSFKPTSPALDVVVNRALASDLQVSMDQVAMTARALIGGEQAGQWQGPDGENHQILVRLPRDERTGVADLDKLYVASYSFNADATPRMVPLRQIADFQPSLSERQIERRNLQRQIQIWGGLAKDATLGEVGGQVEKILDATKLPPGYGFFKGGDQEMMSESGKYAVIALGIAVIFIYLVLASQFGSYLQPLAIMASLPLSLIGVFLALMLFRTTLNIFSVIGFIMLMGLVTKNAILLVDFTNQGIREGKTREQAILDAGQVRLRPILMTTAAMVFGMLPLALALGAGSEQQSPMAHAVIGGIITSTALTLVVVPVLFTYVDTLGRKAKAKLTHSAPAAEDAQPQQAD